ncbi:TerC family protein [Neisseria sp. Ec49-e6-T10]|uniref:TerC family protein n=1 Tax=Neisseria sp. Ec49-e6-T10 TaxID=3140744 RepID=UPI003EB70028
MDFSWLGDAQTWIGFATLIILEVVLGIDNLVFVAILADKVKPADRDKARLVGLSLAIVIRVCMLGAMSLILTLTAPLFTIEQFGLSFSGKDLIMFFGGLFLIYKATTELHERLEGRALIPQSSPNKVYSSLLAVVLQIIVLDAVFSLDSVITAVAMVKHIEIAMFAVIVAMGMMIWASKPLTSFVGKHPTVVMLCLGFLLMIGFSLLAEAFHFEIPKGYLYAAIGFSILVEVFNQISLKNSKENAAITRGWRNRTADAVLGIMGVREAVLAKEKNHQNTDLEDDHFDDTEKSMIRSVLTLAERPVMGVMTPRRDIERLDISQSKEQQKQQLLSTPFTRLIVVGKAGIDEPLGYINKRDLLSQMLKTEELDVSAILRQPLILPEMASTLDAMESFREKAADIAFVVDEFGSILGMLTIKDLLESIAGDFPEAYEIESEPSIQENEDQSFTVEGSFEMSILEQELGLKHNVEEVDYHTVAGLIIEELERIPDVGEWIDYQNWRFEVIEKEGQRIERIKIYPIDESDAD